MPAPSRGDKEEFLAGSGALAQTRGMPAFDIEPLTPFPLGRFAGLAGVAGLAHGVSTRAGPDFSPPTDSPAHAAAARALAAQLDLDAAAWLRQVHGAEVLAATGPGLLGEGDGLVTATPGLALLVRSADCPLILAVAEGATGRAAAVGVAHASWKSTVGGIAGRLVDELAALSCLPPARMRAALAPSAGPCCYEVGGEVREAARSAFGAAAEPWFPAQGGRLVFDLWRANADQLAAAGLPAAQFELAGVCTICEREHFHSWRRDREAAGRFAGAVGLRG